MCAYIQSSSHKPNHLRSIKPTGDSLNSELGAEVAKLLSRKLMNFIISRKGKFKFYI